VRHHGSRYWSFRLRHVNGRCGLVVGCVLCKNTKGFVPGDWQYPSDKVTMSIIIGIGAIGAAASMPNWLLCCIVWAATTLGNDAWWRWWQSWRNKITILVFLHDGTLCLINHGSHPCPMAAMGHHSWLLSIQQSANILWNRSTSLKLEKISLIMFISYSKAQHIDKLLCLFVVCLDCCISDTEHQQQQQRHIYVVYVPPHAPCPWFGMLAMFRAMAAEVW
jgi:hypothetical protein